MTERSENEYRSIFTNEIQTDYSQPVSNNQPSYNSSGGQAPLKLYTDLPLEFLFPRGVGESLLPVTEQKLYLQLSLEFRILLNKAPNYQDGMRNWNLVLPERLQAYGLTREVWDRISFQGDNDPKIQEQLKVLIKKIFQ